MINRRRALMARAEPPTPKNGYVDGSYNVGSGATVYSISNNRVTVSSWTKGSAIKLPLKSSVTFSNGDSVKVYVTWTAGTMSASQYVTVSGGTNYNFATNKNWKSSSNPAYNQTATISFDRTTSNLYLSCDATTSRTYTDYEFEIKVYINNVQVLPEP